MDIIIDEIQKARQTLINIINENFDSMILKLKNQNSNDSVVNTERIICVCQVENTANGHEKIQQCRI